MSVEVKIEKSVTEGELFCAGTRLPPDGNSDMNIILLSLQIISAASRFLYQIRKTYVIHNVHRLHELESHFPGKKNRMIFDPTLNHNQDGICRFQNR
jgi:hypothetical protein